MATSPHIDLGSGWNDLLEGYFNTPKSLEFWKYIEKEYSNETIYPEMSHIFQTLHLTAPTDVRVVILGQDPYHGPGQAHGLAFSVPDGVTIPPSLRNIYKEISSDLGLDMSERNGDLSAWAQRGVLLLNSVLTVRQGEPASHADQGWEAFTDHVVGQLNTQHEHLVFMLWGAYAQRKGSHIDRTRHLVLEAPHPSPLSAHRGFLGCRHFSQCNEYLEGNGGDGVEW